MPERKKARPVTATRFTATKRLAFVRPNAPGGEKVIDAGESFTPDGTMNVDQMLQSGKIVEGEAVTDGEG